MRIFLAVALMAAASWVASASAQSVEEGFDAPLVVACGSGVDHGGGTIEGSDTSGASRGAPQHSGDPEFESGAGPDGRIGTADDEDVAGDSPSRYGVGADGIPGTADDTGVAVDNPTRHGVGPDGIPGTADDEDVAGDAPGDAPSRYGLGPDGIPGTADDEAHAPGKIPGTDGDPNSGRELDPADRGMDGGLDGGMP